MPPTPQTQYPFPSDNLGLCHTDHFHWSTFEYDRSFLLHTINTANSSSEITHMNNLKTKRLSSKNSMYLASNENSRYISN